MNRIIIRPAARRDIDRCADTIARDNRSAGRRFYDAVQQAIRFLAAGPHAGGACEFDDPRLDGLRVWTVRGFENYLIYYIPHSHDITIVRVLLGARDVENILLAGPLP